MTEKAQLNPFVKLALDFGPLILFFVVNGRAGIFWATGVFMAAVLIAILVSYAMIKRFPVMTLVTAFIVIVFGTLTIVLQNDIFVKMKTTIIYLLVRHGAGRRRDPEEAVPGGRVRFGFQSDGGGLARPHDPLDRVLRRDGDHQRDRVAHADHRLLGGVQDLRLRAADLRVRASRNSRCCRNTR